MSKEKKLPGAKTSVYLSDELRRKLGVIPYGSRGASDAVSVIADRYYHLTSTERSKILALFNENEWELMKAVCAGIEWKPASNMRDGVLHCVQDAYDVEFEQMKVSRTQLEGKLRSLTVLQQFTLVEEIESFWTQIKIETEEARNA